MEEQVPVNEATNEVHAQVASCRKRRRQAHTLAALLFASLLGCGVEEDGEVQDEDFEELEIQESSSALQTATFSLIDTRSGQPIPGFTSLINGATITLSTLPTRALSVRANPNGSAGSIGISLDGAAMRVDSSAPHSLCGDRNGVYTACSGINTLGRHTLAATLFPSSRGRGTPISTTQISFTVRESAPTTAVGISISPSSASLASGGSQTLKATVTGSSDQTVSYQVVEGATCGSVTSAGVYTAGSAAATCHVRATPRADASKSATATLTVTSAPPPVSSGSRSAGCGLTGKQKGDFYLTTTDGRGTTRTYEVMVPTDYDPQRALSLSFLYHGAGANEDSAKGFGLQWAPGAASNGIFVFPRGVPYNGGTIGWDDSCSGYDMVFFDRMLSYLQSNYCIDTKRVFAAGFSWGGDYVTALNCCRGDKLRGIAPASCSDEFRDRNDYKTYRFSPCPVAPASAIRFTHQVNGDSGYAAPLFATTSALYRSFNGCSATSSTVSPSPCVAYSGCARPVVDCAYSNIGHALPPNWAADTWSFFSTLQ